jgi:DNA-binding PadR family transcriptional regulator
MHKRRGLRMMVVSLLASSPKNGVEIMDGVEIMTRGWWRPTPGSIYPLLSKMTDEGSIRKLEDGRYELTPGARKELEVSMRPQPRGEMGVGEMLGEMKSLVSYMEDKKNLDPTSLDSSQKAISELAERLTKLLKEGPGS